jgi:hypothetical protein
MSGMVQPLSGPDIATLSQELRDSANIYIPPETLLEDLPKVLMISLKQRRMVDDEESEVDTVVEPQPVYMSLEPKDMPVTKKEAEHLLQLGALNPKTKEPFTLEDFEIADDPRDALNLALTRNIVDEKKKHLRSSVESLVSEGRCTEEYAEKTLYPKIDEYQLSLGDGGVLKDQDIDMMVDFIRNSPSQGQANQPAKKPLETIHNPDEETTDLALTEEQANAMVKDMLTCMD